MNLNNPQEKKERKRSSVSKAFLWFWPFWKLSLSVDLWVFLFFFSRVPEGWWISAFKGKLYYCHREKLACVRWNFFIREHDLFLLWVLCKSCYFCSACKLQWPGQGRRLQGGKGFLRSLLPSLHARAPPPVPFLGSILFLWVLLPFFCSAMNTRYPGILFWPFLHSILLSGFFFFFCLQ